MHSLIAPVGKELLMRELNAESFVRVTHKARKHIYIVDGNTAPHTMREIGRLREETFRRAGGGTGLSCDLDEFDAGEHCYSQMIVWDPEDLEIVGGYRFIRGDEVPLIENGEPRLATHELLDYSPAFIRDYLPHTIELGRSFVQPRYQPNQHSRKGLFSLDNLWDGLGAIIVDNPDIRYLFGKVTMYPQFDRLARDLILYFMQRYFPDDEQLVVAKTRLPFWTDASTLTEPFAGLTDYESALPALNNQVRARGENIPPLINAYMSLSSTMKTFGTARNSAFGDVEETGIMIVIDDVYAAKLARHVDTYTPVSQQRTAA